MVIAVALIGAASGHLGAALAHPQKFAATLEHQHEKPRHEAKAKHEKKHKGKKSRKGPESTRAKTETPKAEPPSASPMCHSKLLPLCNETAGVTENAAIDFRPLVLALPPYRGSQADLFAHAMDLLKSGANFAIERRTLTEKELAEVLAPPMFTIHPLSQQGRHVGLQVQNPLGGQGLSKLGLMSGDVIVAIHGEPLRSPENVLETYARVQKLRDVVIEFFRGSKRVVLYLQVK